MIRGKVNNGIIQPLEPLPADWQNGHDVVVVELPKPDSHDDTDFAQWAEEMKRLTAELNDAEEWEQIDAALAEQDRHSKAIVRDCVV